MSATHIVPEPTDSTDEPVDPYAHLATTLRAIADGLAGLAGRDLATEVHVSLSFQPATDLPDELKVRTTDAIGQALLGEAGATAQIRSGSYRHEANGWCGGGFFRGVSVAAFANVTPPEKRALQEEVERLRAERDRLAAEVDAAKAAGR